MDKSNKKSVTEKLLTLEIGRLDDSFRGVAYIGAKRYAVSGALPKEKIIARIQKTENNDTYAEAKKVIDASPDRVKSPCGYFGHCGGCQILHLDYQIGLKYKTALIKKKLMPLGFCAVEDCVSLGGSACRNKAHIAFWGKGDRLEIGFFNEETHRVIDISDCLMHGVWYNGLSKVLRSWITEFEVTIYDVKTARGFLRFAAARYIGGVLMLTVVSVSDKIGNLDELYTMLKTRFPRVSLWLNVNSEKTNEVMAGRLKHISGEKKLSASMLGVRYELSPNSFFQVNEAVAEAIYIKAVDIIKNSGADTVIDAYSGIGLTSALFAKAGLKVVSIEIVPEAVSDARELCRKNKISGVEHICGDVQEVLPTLPKDGKTAFFVDPPRAGIGAEVASSITAFAPNTIIYLSCNPYTLSAELSLLCAEGYKIISATPFDMFPNSRHLETLVCITRK